MERPVAWTKVKEDEKITAFADAYKAFLDRSKTERECVATSVELAESAGFVNLRDIQRTGSMLKPGDRVYRNWMNKSFMAFIVGSRPIEEGMNILGAHIDSPRLDAKQNPLYEKDNITYLNTHYYGGIKKYQWTTLPLAIHGVVCKKDGTTVNVVIGENNDESTKKNFVVVIALGVAPKI